MAEYSIEASISADIGKFKRAINKAKEVTQRFKKESEDAEDTELNADIKPLKRNLKKAKLMMNNFTKEKPTVEVDADTSEAKKKIGFLMAVKKALSRKVVIPVKVAAGGTGKVINKFQDRMDKLANSIRVVGTVSGSVFRGILLSVLPALVPIVASLAGAVGGLASSFVALGGAAGAFGIAAVGNAQKLSEHMSEIKKINEQIAKERKSAEPDQEKINALLKERTSVLGSMSKEEKSAMKQVNKFKDAWKDFLKETEKPVFQVFADGLKVATSLLDEMKPIIKPVADAISGLLDQFNDFSKTKQFQSFIDFFAGRGAKAISNWGQIAGNVFRGFMELMKAFGPLAGTMEEGLIGLTERFAEWASKVGESDGFKSFINYVKENGPKVMALIGNITDFLIELGKGMAPLGSKILDIVNGFLSFTTALMENHPMIAKIIGIVLSLSGVLLALTPLLILVQTAFGTMAKFIWLKTGMMRAKVLTGINMMIKDLGRFIVKMVTTVAKFVAQSVIFIAKWALMGAKALIHGARMATGWAIATGKKMVVALTKMAATTATFIAKWALIGAKATLNAGKMAAAWALSTGKKLAVASAKMIATTAMFVAKWAWVGAKSLLHAAKVAAAWFIALGPVGWVIATVIGLVALIIANWDKVWSWTKKTWNKIWGAIKDIAGKIWSKVTDVFNNIVDFFGGINLYDSGKAIIQSAIDGLLSMKDKILGVVDNIVGAVRDFWPFSPAKRGPLSDINKMDFGGPIGDSIRKAKAPIERSMNGLALVARKSFNPDLQVKGITSGLKGLKKSATTQVQSGVNADVQVSKQPIQIIIRNEADAEWLRTYVNEGNAVDTTMSVMD